GLGGGLGLRKTGPAAVIDNEFRRNLANNALSGGGLGGACAIEGGYQNQPIMLQGNIFNDNSGSLTTDADPGSATSAIALIGDNLAAPDLPAIDLRNITIDRNRILGSGQNLPVDTPPNNFAISIQGADLFTITNNVIAGSTLGGIVAIHKLFDSEGNTFETRGAIHNNTFYANGDYGLWLLSRWTTSALSLVNNSIVSHTFGIEGEDLYGPAAPVTLSYTLFYSNSQEIGPDADDSITSTHTIVGNPQFLSPTAYDFHLMPNSAAIDAGDPAGVPPAPAVDIDGALRPYGPRVDVGAYEWQGQGALLPIIIKE
ncbi:MAG: right-handed parallel beta-helix repeat-containing protein, partial [Caldilineaceae bacterium]|nr:right-handed parallel beta-helix repeat-containing protein [Caldilineaceae bacterium]